MASENPESSPHARAAKGGLGIFDYQAAIQSYLCCMLGILQDTAALKPFLPLRVLMLMSSSAIRLVM